MKSMLNITALLVAGLLSGCAPLIYEGRLSTEDGWREGKITAVGKGATFAAILAENCQVSPLIRSADIQYLTIQYRRNNRPVSHTVPTPADSPWKVNDLVYVNPKDCSHPVERRAG
jgi:hypothetical protein